MTKIVIDKENEIAKLENMLETLTDEKDKQSVRFAINVISGFNDVLSERPTGEWIMQRHDLDGCFYTCSNCGQMIRVPLFIDDPEDNETLADYPFCHCGADMRKGSKE